ncbi:MAG: ATP-dependent DNA helicase DinG [Candidatus Electronema aureum]|uniref:DNA 5'-3' helicase n=1 Tax=Candidatus Electronema aureum TaxID=2005002 RepID=A0A521G1Z1_9BACT|nr:MAG: ATP-dependent DNA helicase DinG [Candidatus Electronema aureum]
MEQMKEIFGPAGILSRHLPEHEARLGQQKMAAAVAKLLARQDDPPAACLIVEAETGLGKTLAYLIPTVLSGRKAMVSTNTRNLQDQILSREIPFIREHLAPDLKAMCVKGRQNYLCLHRWHQLTAGGQQELFAAAEESGDITTAQLRAWLKKTTFADRAELPSLSGSSSLWQKICCQTHFCLGSDCPDHSRCYLNKVRREAATCQLLVVNHHLLFSDLAVRRSGYGEVLPRYETVIFDEAHHLEDIAAQFFGFSFSRYQLVDLIADVEKAARESGGKRKHKKIFTAVENLAGIGERFFNLFPPPKGRFSLPDLFAAQPVLVPLKDALRADLEFLADQLELTAEKETDGPWKQFLPRCEDMGDCLDQITTQPTAEQSSHVRWFERSEKNLTLTATPIDVATDLQKVLFAQVQHCVFTSATLSAGVGFGYFSRRLGIPENSPSLSFPSPFDYKKRTLLYVPDGSFPEPNGPGYREKLHQEIKNLLICSRGRALVLFTSFQALELAWHSLRDELNYPLLRQGTASRQQLLTRFSEETDSVLFAVASFWEGVDVPGESLSMVIIDKLPFEVPTDPVLLARIERIKATGGNPFSEFQVPRAILGLRQGVGRLMRRAGDRGVAAVLDVRLFTKPYGGRFIASLPPSPLTRTMREVKKFFAS